MTLLSLYISCAAIAFLSKSSEIVFCLSFEVLSHFGELLVSCRKYSVAWVPRGVVIQEQKESRIPIAGFETDGLSRIFQSGCISNHKFDVKLYYPQI
jgi:hypothetical protein